MKLIIALGNPGKEYRHTRHNTGFLMINYLQEILNFTDFKFDKKFNAEISENKIGDEKIILAKPQTFMNNSGQSVQALINFYKIPVEEIIVIHDELDLKLGDFKISRNKNASGHNGVLSIFNHLNTKDFTRIRVGVDNRNENERKNISGSDYVLGRFSKEELEILNDIFEKAVKELKL
ncbi:MAG: aminoacyl-tRNA hydrolase [Candidatus Moranbacteria bacterium]|nr:aminoacyl-tRNA hydrolase [Candidatus Moranbacteria bacterium]